MGKNRKPTAANEKDNLLARNQRKRNEHMPRQVAAAAAPDDKEEDIVRPPRNRANDIAERGGKGRAKDKKGNNHNQPNDRRVHLAQNRNVVENNVTAEVHQHETVNKVTKKHSLESLDTTTTNTKKNRANKSNSNTIIDNNTVKTSPSPKAPRWDMKKLQELFEKSKISSIVKLKEYYKNECVETEDSIKLSQLPRFNGISRGIETMVNEIAKTNEKTSQVLMERNKKQQQEFRTIFNEEFFIMTDLKKYETALTELKSILKKEELSIDDDPEEMTVPTRTAFKEVTGILRNFIAVRNDRLVKCFATDFRKNKVGDNYTNQLCQFERNKSLIKCIREKRMQNKLGNRVLAVSTKLLEKVLNQLRHQTKKALTKNGCTTWKQWNKKICRFDSMVKLNRKNINQMKMCLADKRVKIISTRKNVNEIDEQAKLYKVDLKNAEINFENNTMESKSYVEKALIVTQKEKILEDIQSSYKKDLVNIDSLKIKLEECIKEERNIDHLYEEVNKVTEKVKTNHEKWRENEKFQFQLKEEIRLKNGIMLRHEEIQQEIQSEKICCRKDYADYVSQLKNASYQKERLTQKLRSTTNQAHNYQQYRNLVGNNPLRSGLALAK